MKPRTHIKKSLGNYQISGERPSMTRMGSTSGIISKTLRDTSLNPNITTPDKPMPSSTLYKSNSSNKKSSIKQYKPSEINQCRIPRPALYEINGRRPAVQSRNCKIENRKVAKLDFGSQGSLKLSSTRSRKSLNPTTASYKHIAKVISKDNSEN